METTTDRMTVEEAAVLGYTLMINELIERRLVLIQYLRAAPVKPRRPKPVKALMAPDRHRRKD